MILETKTWEPLTDCPPSDQFVSQYSGPYAQQLELNRPAIEKFLDIASLDGRVLLTNNSSDRYRAAPDINPDGSTTGKGKLRWGEQLNESTSPDKDSSIYPDNNGWVLSINGDLMRDKAAKKTNGDFRAVAGIFTKSLNNSLIMGLEEMLLRDKFTFAKDPYLIGRALASASMIILYRGAVIDHGFGDIFFGGTSLAYMAWVNLINKEENDKILEFSKRMGVRDNFLKFLNYHRRTVKTPWEGLTFPLEVDRAILASGYFLGQKIKRTPLVRVSN